MTDKRLRFLQEMLTGIKVIKLHAWEDVFLAKLHNFRNQELALIRQRNIINGSYVAITTMIPALASAVAFAVHVLTGHHLTADIVFSSLTYYAMLEIPLSNLPILLNSAVELKSSLKNIEEFLSSDQLKKNTVLSQGVNAIEIQDGSFKWLNPSKKSLRKKTVPIIERKSETRRGNPKKLMKIIHEDACIPDRLITPNTTFNFEHQAWLTKNNSAASLEGINITIERGSLVMIVGPVGSGKSSLIAAILNEMPLIFGRISISGSRAICPQTSWIQNASIRENIVFGLEFNEERYEKVLFQCSLHHDISTLPFGDFSEVGERGVVSLSGGQRSRINLARLVYKGAQVALLDDPLSALDAKVANNIFQKCINSGLLKNSTRILVTHQIGLLPFADHIIVMKDGKISEQGNFKDIFHGESSFSKLIQNFFAEEQDKKIVTDESLYSSSISTSSKNFLDSCKSQDRFRAEEIQIETERENEDDQEEDQKFMGHYISNQDNNIVSSSIGGRGINSQAPSGSANSKNQYLQVEMEYRLILRAASVRPILSGCSTTEASPLFIKSQSKPHLYGNPYSIYVESAGGALYVLSVVIVISMTEVVRIGKDVWMTFWLDKTFGLSQMTYMVVNGGFGLALGICTGLCILVFYLGGDLVARKIHFQAATGLFKSPIQFFESTPLGRVLNRFSRDQELIDNQLADDIYFFLFVAGTLISAFVVVVAMASWKVAFIILIPFGSTLWIMRLYRRCARRFQRLYEITLGPVMTLLSETFTGAKIIRAFDNQSLYKSKFGRSLEALNGASFVQLSLRRWISLRSEIIGAILLLCISIGCVFFAIPAAVMGLLLSTLLGLGSSLDWFIRQFADTEQNMTAVSKLAHYANDLVCERQDGLANFDSCADDEQIIKPPLWPCKGRIEIRNLCIGYRAGMPPVLQGITATIEPGEKIAIVGRTGAGKSTILAAFFRLVEHSHGCIIIDSVNISHLSLHLLRDNLCVIPQEPVLFSGSLRFNLDPRNMYDDATIWSVLQKVGMRDLLLSREASGSGLLDKPICEFSSGGGFSNGQKQLLCIARALLHPSKVVLMDEPTSNMDQQTDDLIQDILWSCFEEATVLTITHRLSGITDYDRVMVLDHGRIAEFDDPDILLSNPNSLLSGMCRESQSMSSGRH